MERPAGFLVYLYVVIGPIFTLYAFLQGWLLQGVTLSNLEVLTLGIILGFAVLSMIGMILEDYDPVRGWNIMVGLILLAGIGYLGFRTYQVQEIPLFFMHDELVLFAFGVYILSGLHVLYSLPRLLVYVFMGFSLVPLLFLSVAFGWILRDYQQMIPAELMAFEAIAVVGFVAASAVLGMVMDPVEIAPHWSIWVFLSPIVISQSAFILTGADFGQGVGFVWFSMITYANSVLHVLVHETVGGLN